MESRTDLEIGESSLHRPGGSGVIIRVFTRGRHRVRAIRGVGGQKRARPFEEGPGAKEPSSVQKLKRQANRFPGERPL